MSSSLEEALQKRKDRQLGVIWASDISLSSDGSLYLGNGQDASNLEQLHSHNVTHILNVADDVPNFHEQPSSPSSSSASSTDEEDGSGINHGIIVYCNLFVGDFGADAGISRVFEKAIEFTKTNLDLHNNILIHCANGSNRSCTVAIALLSHIYGLTLKEAFIHVKRRHRATNPLKDNRKQLREWEKSTRLLVESTMSDDDFNMRVR
jgi:protein tyrosine/serine phosphatase